MGLKVFTVVGYQLDGQPEDGVTYTFTHLTDCTTFLTDIYRVNKSDLQKLLKNGMVTKKDYDEEMGKDFSEKWIIFETELNLLAVGPSSCRLYKK